MIKHNASILLDFAYAHSIHTYVRMQINDKSNDYNRYHY